MDKKKEMEVWLAKPWVLHVQHDFFFNHCDMSHEPICWQEMPTLCRSSMAAKLLPWLLVPFVILCRCHGSGYNNLLSYYTADTTADIKTINANINSPCREEQREKIRLWLNERRPESIG